MNTQLFEALDALEKTKGISADYLIEKIQAALVSACKKETGNTSVSVEIDRAKKTFKVYSLRTVVEEVTDPKTQISLESARAIRKGYKLNDVVKTELKTKDFGRISAQTAKQVFIQGIREAEKNNIAREFERKREEVISGRVTKRDDNNGDVWIDTGSNEIILPRNEQIPGEDLYVGDRVRVFVTEVSRDSDNNPDIHLSRVSNAMVKRMFETDIPEIADGIVLVKSVAREPGSRTKVAVVSRDPEVDAVGACIGNRGTRIAAIVEELRGEKIDVIEYSEDLGRFIAAALSPAEVLSVEFDSEKSARVTVALEQLSLAIGKEGQNARLAAKLTGCKIDIKGV